MWTKNDSAKTRGRRFEFFSLVFYAWEPYGTGTETGNGGAWVRLLKCRNVVISIFSNTNTWKNSCFQGGKNLRNIIGDVIELKITELFTNPVSTFF